ncbi:ATP-dependent RNA helicase HrpA [Desulfopila sp. IMCC35008]|uniref:ATP-dependent RNA helicase HrpA n=1 Tax=Desulfopila sp. IMCC35008 TaxID=2653858 RepID=UPI0013CFD33F|nr:ATP-dependent RNA helicase HrpA [Desulfopila sp. IMCC35008]
MKYFYPQELPIVEKIEEIAATLITNQVVIVAGDTGSGKTTQIPKICLEHLDIGDKIIGCTQPRRIAATSISGRVAEELGKDGHLVGYKIRFHDHTNKNTRIKFMTDGVLLAESRNDKLLRQYGAIILDEAHERSLNIDFLLGYLKNLLQKRRDLKLIVTSATIDTDAFSKHFGNAPIVSVSGRTYPVTVRYQPLPDTSQDDRSGYVEHCAETIVRIFRNEPPGDILAFLPTEKDIRTCCELVADKVSPASVLPLFGRLASHEQKQIFQPHHHGKIVIATNVAETSLTVPGIRYVVDSGLARMSYYSGRSKTTSLPVRRVSRASCNQRKGRCGRVGPGVCIRLYDEEDYLDREEFTLPEIKRSNLAEVILQMISLRLGSIEDYPFIDPPQRPAIRDGYRLLFELGAISKDNQLTKTGQMMAGFPIDPCISRILIEASAENCLKEVKIIAAALAIQDPRSRPTDKEKEADAVHKQFSHPHSDFMGYLNLWNHFHTAVGGSRSWSKLKKYCKTNYLSFQRMREWFDLHEQLDRLLKRNPEFTDNNEDASYQQVHRALTTGFLRNIACKKQGKIYQNGSNKELMIFPGSHQFTSGGQWIVAGSFLETNRLYALTVATIEPEWLECIGRHLVKYSWSNPRWNQKSGQVVADEKVSLFGLVVVAARTVNFPKQNDQNIPVARGIFIQAALIEGGLQGKYLFLNKNRALIEKWQKEEDKLRSGSILNDESSFFLFYADKLPAHVCDKSTLNRYLKRHGHKRLLMTDADVLNRRPDENQLADYPNSIHAGSIELLVDYVFSPGSKEDGMSVKIPLMSADTISDQIFEWLVPGLLKEKVTLLLKGLPKKLRRHLVPVNVAVDRLLDDLNIYKGSLYHSLESSIYKLYSLQINRSDWPAEVPTHLMARFVLIDNNGNKVAAGRNFKKLLSDTLTPSTPGSSQKSAQKVALPESLNQWKTLSTKKWAFHDLPRNIPVHNAANDIIGFFYPFLVIQPEKGAVAVDFTTDRHLARKNNRKGVEYLYRIQFAAEYKSFRKYAVSLLSGPSTKAFLMEGIKTEELRGQFISFVMRTLFPSINGEIPEREVFQNNVAEVRQKGFFKQAQQFADEAITVIRKKNEVRQRLNRFCKLDKSGHLFSAEKVKDFNNLMDEIVPVHYFGEQDKHDIATAIRQLRSLDIRIERYYANPSKDGEKMAQLKPHLASCRELTDKQDELNDEAVELLKQYKVLIGEYRISLFSPEIKTSQPISPKKLQKFRQKLLAKC